MAIFISSSTTVYLCFYGSRGWIFPYMVFSYSAASIRNINPMSFPLRLLLAFYIWFLWLRMYSSFRIFYKSNLKVFWFIPLLLCWDKIYQSFLQILLLLTIWTERLLSTVCLIALLSSLHASCLFILPLADKHRPCSRGLSRGPLLTQTALPECTGLSRGLPAEESTC